MRGGGKRGSEREERKGKGEAIACLSAESSSGAPNTWERSPLEAGGRLRQGGAESRVGAEDGKGKPARRW